MHIRRRILRPVKPWPESSQPGSTRPGPIKPTIFNYKNASTILFMCFTKNVQQKFEGISISLVCQS